MTRRRDFRVAARSALGIRSMLVAGLAMLAAGCGRSSGGHDLAAPVRVVAVEHGDIATEVSCIGTVTPVTSVAVKSRVDGQIMEVAVHDGADVRRGELLFRIDPRPFVVQRDVAAANLARDEALLAKAVDLEQRSEELVAKGYISTNQYAYVKNDRLAAAATVEADRAALANARLNLEFTELRSPIDGRVGRVALQRGNLVKANDTSALLTINQVDPIYVDFTVPERYFGELRRSVRAGGVAVSLTTEGPGGPPLERSGPLTFLDNQVDASTGTVRLRATLVNTDRALWPGQFARVTLHLPGAGPVLWVPARAVGEGPEGAFVYVVGPKHVAEQRSVRVERTEGDRAVITSGVAAGDSVIVDGQSRVLPGGPVTIAAEPVAAPAVR